jgi:hypothetical protein
MQIESPASFIGLPLLVVNMGLINNLEEEDFSLPNKEPFVIKNDCIDVEVGTLDIELKVVPAGSKTGE